MAVFNIVQHNTVAAYPPENPSNAHPETQSPGTPIVAPENFTVTGANRLELNASPAPLFCMVGAVTAGGYVISGLVDGVIAAGEGKYIPEGQERLVHIAKGHTHLLFFGA